MPTARPQSPSPRRSPRPARPPRPRRSAPPRSRPAHPARPGGFNCSGLALTLALAFAIVAGTASTIAAAERVPWTTGRVVGSPYPPAPFAIERVLPGITFDHPVDFAVAPGSTRLFVAEQSGKMWSLNLGPAGAADGKGKPALALDLRQHHRPLDNILGFAFHPGFATNRQVFINYNEPGGRENGSIVARFTVRPTDPPTIDPSSAQVLIRWFSGGHNGCTLAFGHDGFLYISTGDAGDPDPPDGRRRTGQDIGDLLASILRIDVDPPTGTNTYRVPPDNPFVHQAGARPEVWAFGFRNPYRMSFDRATGDLWVGDVGWEMWEMVHRVVRGGNYGWPLVEGPNRDVRRDIQPGPGPIRPPVIALPHSEAASITGGAVYRGSRLAGLQGAYVYGDWETGKFWALRHREGVATANDELCDTTLKPVAFTPDPEGDLLILDYNGGLYRFVPNPATGGSEAFPRRLAETGLFASVQPLRPAPGTVSYRIAAPQWNDHATAEWLLAVPGRGAIATAGGVGNIAGGTWAFPSNTVLARTLTLEREAGRPASAQPIETQLLHWDGQAWNPYTYRWRPDASDADLVGPAGTNDVIAVQDSSAPGGRRETPWRFQSRSECLRCHNAWAGDALTLNWAQLGSPKAPQSQLRELVRAGVLQLRDAPDRTETLTHPADDTAPLADRARSWLHVNCSGCHRFGAGGAVAIHLNLEKPAAETRALNERPLRGDLGLVDARIIAPGEPWRSTLLYRIATEGAGRMPHIGSRLADPGGVALIRDWIQSLPPSVAATNSTQLRADLAALGGPVGDRPVVVGRLLATMNGSLALLDRARADTPLRSLAADVAARHTNAMVRDLFQQLLPPDRRRPTLGQEFQPAAILALAGDAARGREVFHGAAQCAQCHALDGRGRAFGPDLRGIRRKYQRPELLQQIVSPSQSIAPEFRSVTVTLKDGSEYTGFILRKTATKLVLKDSALVEHELALAQIDESRESTLSAMAEGLLAPLTAQEAADLLEYLLRVP